MPLQNMLLSNFSFIYNFLFFFFLINTLAYCRIGKLPHWHIELMQKIEIKQA